MTAESGLMNKVAERLSQPPSDAPQAEPESILLVAAGAYGAQTSDTQPTGFDPEVAALFEALVESAYLVANADRDFDAIERAAFQNVVVSACRSQVSARQVAALVADLHDQLEEDGEERRVERIGRSVSKPEHKLEVLRVATLVAQISGGISGAESRVLTRLSEQLGVAPSELEAAVREAERVASE